MVRYFNNLAILLVLLFLLLAHPAAQAQNNSLVPDSSAARQPADAPTVSERPIRVEVDLVLVNVSVIDRYNRFVTGFQKEHFEVFEDKEQQEILHFSTEEVPISVGLVFDVSGSMSNKINTARMAVRQFLRMANPGDDYFLVTFDDRPHHLSGFTQDPVELQNKLSFSETKGRTALYDSVYLALHEMESAKHSRKVLIVFSDGGDNHSRYSARDVERAVEEADVQIYSVGIYEPYASRSRTAEELAGPSVMRDIAEMTGGRHFPVDNLNDLPDIARKIGYEIRNLYVLGYAPGNDERDGKWRKINVEVNPPRGLPRLRLYNKAGYYAPQP